MSKNNLDQYLLSDEELKKVQDVEKQALLDLQKHYHIKLNSYIDTFDQLHSDEAGEYFDNLVAAIYLIFKERYPNLSIKINYRDKATNSFINNIKKNTNLHFKEIKDNKFTKLNDDKIIVDIMRYYCCFRSY